MLHLKERPRIPEMRRPHLAEPGGNVYLMKPSWRKCQEIHTLNYWRVFQNEVRWLGWMFILQEFRTGRKNKVGASWLHVGVY